MVKDVRNIQHVVLNGIKTTIFEVWEYKYSNGNSDNNHAFWLFSYKSSIKGWYKRKNTIIKHYSDESL